jgi:ABC-type antimicrobial peptide transport system permease subunit
MGVRQALGAQPLQMLTATLRHVAVPVGVGLLAGIAASTQVGRLLQTQLVGVSTSVPGSILAALLLLTVVCVVALTVPAVRALRADPLTALRGDG